MNCTRARNPFLERRVMIQAMTWTNVVACVGYLALALVAFVRAGRSALGMPLLFLFLDLLGWSCADGAYNSTHQKAWHWLDLTLSPFTPPLALHVALVFTGRARARRPGLVVAYAGAGAFSAVAASCFVIAAPRAWLSGTVWSLAFSALELAVTGVAVFALATHLRRTDDHAEAMRARLILLAFVVGIVSGTSELLNNVWPQVPAFGHVGLLAGTSVMAAVVLRLRLLGSELSAVGLYAAGLAALAVIAYAAVFRWLPLNGAMAIVAATLVTIALGALVREVAQTTALRRERTLRLAVLGKMSDQLAHDLKNPLAAMKGAVQFLKEERARGASLDGHDEMLELMLQQTERMSRSVDRYRNYGRVAPSAQEDDVNAIVRRVLSLEQLASGKVVVEARLAEDLPQVPLDADLFAHALENVVQNALEAMPGGGVVRVRTEKRGAGVSVAVEDDGPGMDAREVERALDDFFTTKPNGTGLGLAFARRVAEAHGGRVTVTSRLGKGTVVAIDLPVEAG
jgi:signal transduction histidine kinase